VDNWGWAMGWKEYLKDFRLIDFQLKIKDIIKGQQVGIVNVTVYNINMPQDMVEKIVDLKVTETIENAVKEKVFFKLDPISSELDMLPESMTASVVTSAMATTALKISLAEHIITSDNIDLKIKE